MLVDSSLQLLGIKAKPNGQTGRVSTNAMLAYGDTVCLYVLEAQIICSHCIQYMRRCHAGSKALCSDGWWHEAQYNRSPGGLEFSTTQSCRCCSWLLTISVHAGGVMMVSIGDHPHTLCKLSGGR